MGSPKRSVEDTHAKSECSSQPSNGDFDAQTRDSEPINIDLPGLSAEEVVRRTTNGYQIPDEPTIFEDLIEKIRTDLEPTFGAPNSYPRSVNNLGMEDKFGKLVVTTEDLSFRITGKQKQFISYLFSDTAKSILKEREEDMGYVYDQMYYKTNGTMDIPESELAAVDSFMKPSARNLDYVDDMKAIITQKGCSPEHVYASD